MRGESPYTVIAQRDETIESLRAEVEHLRWVVETDETIEALRARVLELEEALAQIRDDAGSPFARLVARIALGDDVR